MQNVFNKSILLFNLVLAILIAYQSAFRGIFILDDIPSITHNAALHDLSNLKRVLFEFPNLTRPVVSLSLAIDYALFGDNPAYYHVLNIAVHIGAALLLFGIVRRSLLTGRFAKVDDKDAVFLAFGVVIIWALHPLQTESVTYIIQRAESIMGFFFLLSLYAVIRGAETSDDSKGHWNRWNMLAVLAAVLGAGCKQVIATLPIIVLLYDRCFISGTFKNCLKRAPALYAGLCLSWVVIGVLLALVPEFSSAGFGMKKITMLGYAQSQFVVIVNYIKLIFWPRDLCLDYVWMIERNYARILPCAAIVLGLLGAVIWQLARNTVAGFWGAWFFVILAPSSSILPIGDLAFEHRLYLPLAGVVMLLLLALYNWALRWSSNKAGKLVVGLVIPIAFAFLMLTAQRNVLYASNLDMWRDILAKRPRNPRALLVIGNDALQHGDLKTARDDFERAIAASKDFHESHASMAELLLAEGKPDDAVVEFRTALELNPRHARSFLGLYGVLLKLGKPGDAFQTLSKAAEALPNDPHIQAEYGRALFQMRRYQESIQAFELAVNQAPNSGELHNSLGGALAVTGRMNEALAEFDAALKFQPRSEGALFNRGNVLERLGHQTEAMQSYAASLELNANHVNAANALAWILATSSDDKLRDGKKAVALAEKICALAKNSNPLFEDTLAAAYAEIGNFADAQLHCRNALTILPENSPLRADLNAHAELYAQNKPLRK